jgi:hypothetical protein
MTVSDDPAGPVAGPVAGPDADLRHARRERTRRRLVRRRRRIAGLALIAAVAALALGISGLGGGSHQTPPSSALAAPRPAAPRTTASQTGAPHPSEPPHPAGPSPGSLPQTHAYPSAADARFGSLMASLWSGVVQDSLAPAVPAFFPKDAYVQLKAIPSASSDWTDRLVHDYGLDISAAHAQLGANAANARLIGVNAPSGNGHWIEPGVCYNAVGYYEMPNARVVYREDGQTRSFGIASMISWRGVWYVVHLGAILRSADTGMVDEPESGPGSSAYSATC